MSARDRDGVARVLILVARKLEEYLDGDELALETLGEALDQDGVSPDDVQAAALGIRGLAGMGPPEEWVADPQGHDALRVLSTEERDSLTPEAWGYLLEQRSRGTLDADQLERVLETLTSIGERPVAVERARDVASRVALASGGGPAPGEDLHGDQEVAH